MTHRRKSLLSLTLPTKAFKSMTLVSKAVPSVAVQSKAVPNKTPDKMPPILSLPIHLVGDILRELDDVQYLLDAILSCQLFYIAFKETPALPADVLQRQLPEELFPLAIAAVVSHPSIRNLREISDSQFMNDYYDDPFGAVGGRAGFTLAQAMRVVDLCRTVRKVYGICCERSSRYFVFQAERRRGVGYNAMDPVPRHDPRWYRALFRFEIYCNLFYRSYQFRRSEEYIRQKASKALFFGRYAMPVNNDLRSVHDRLEERLGPCIEGALVPRYTYFIPPLPANDPRDVALRTELG
ncbi:hypothetical protein G7046_g4890 [Stylonectria norvegica]|nr:hypothetical protein G7046_g4890 [Stylonectria norvegica]